MCFSNKWKKKARELDREKKALEKKLKGVVEDRDKCWEDREALKKKYDKCKEELEECEEEEEPKPIEILSIKNGKFFVNGAATKLIGISKREMIAVGSGDLSALRMDYTFKPIHMSSGFNYDYDWIKEAIIKSKCNYIRVICPLDTSFFRHEVKDYLKNGIVVEVELFDSANPNRPYQAPWKDAFNATKDLPVFCDAHNEFCDQYHVNEVIAIIDYVKSHGGLIGAGAWGASNHGKEYADELKASCNKYQIVTHHRQWNKQSIEADREPGKPLVWNEIHTRDHNLDQVKQFLRNGYQWCEGVQVYSLLNYGWGNTSNFKKLLDYVGVIK